MSTLPAVSLCIPAYRAETFIARTLACAREQTYENIRINVSIDGDVDRTATICHQAASEDDRISVVVQDDRLGWSQNTNAALAMADTEYVGVYFHDDVIEPTYVERLVAALDRRTDAASAHCDLVEFGLADETRPAHQYDGTPLHRVVDFLMTQRGTTLRSLMRRSVAGDLRFPVIHGDNHWSAYVFHVALVAAGPALAVHEPLYRRWQRADSMTRSEGWIPPTLHDLLRGQEESLRATRAVLERHLPVQAELGIAMQALIVFQRTFVRRMQQRLGNDEKLPAGLDWEPAARESAAIGEETWQLLRDGERRLMALDRGAT